jgi:hypothetical protein
MGSTFEGINEIVPSTMANPKRDNPKINRQFKGFIPSFSPREGQYIELFFPVIGHQRPHFR